MAVNGSITDERIRTDEVLVANELGEDGVRVVHVMGNGPIGDGWLRYVPAGATPQVKRWKEASGTHQLEMRWPVHEAVDVYFEGLPRKYRRFVVWKIEGRISTAIREAAQRFCELFGRAPGFAFVRSLPAGVENGVEVPCEFMGIKYSVMVFRAEWAMLERCVFVGGAQRIRDGGI